MSTGLLNAGKPKVSLVYKPQQSWCGWHTTLLMAFSLFKFKIPAQDWIRAGLGWFWLAVSIGLSQCPLAANLEAAEEGVLVPLSHVSSLSCFV